MKRIFTIALAIIVCKVNAQTGNVGIGTNNPVARLHVADSAVLFSGTTNFLSPGLPPASGAGTRFMWYPAKSATRFGFVNSDEWNEVNVGYFSFAAGNQTRASGEGGVSLGQGRRHQAHIL